MKEALGRGLGCGQSLRDSGLDIGSQLGDDLGNQVTALFAGPGHHRRDRLGDDWGGGTEGAVSAVQESFLDCPGLPVSSLVSLVLDSDEGAVGVNIAVLASDQRTVTGFTLSNVG